MIFITGHHDAGKSTIAGFLRDHGFLHVETSSIVRAKHQELAPHRNFGEWAKEQNHFFDKYIAQAVFKAEQAIRHNGNTNQDVIVTGNRQIAGIDYLINKVPALKPNLIIYVEADEETLFDRHMKRPDRRIEGLTLQRFKDEILAYDIEMGVELIKPIADIVICNNGDDVKPCFETTSSFLRSKGYIFANNGIEHQTKGKEF